MSARIPRSATMAAIAILASAGAHLGALALRPAPEPVEVEGGGGAQMAMEGTSFEDMAQGTLEAVSSDLETPVVRPNAAPPVEAERTPPAPMAEIVEPVEPTPSVQARPPIAHAAPSIPGAPRVAVPTAPTPTVPPVAAAPRVAASPDVTETATVVEDTTTPRLSNRPPTRPAAIEARAAALQAQRDAEAARARDQAAAQQTRRGNEARQDSRRGAVGGEAQGEAVSSGSGQTQAAGNAAASNYPGQVQRRIQRQRMPRGVGQGTVRVSFTIAGNGGLAAIALAAPSGSGELDQAALRIIQRAAPFPPPPPGANRDFVIPIQGR